MESPVINLIAEDPRGASWSIVLPDNTEIVLIYSKKGVYRGGHFHNRAETSMLLSGKVHYWKEESYDKVVEFDEFPGQTLHNEPGEIHLARFDQESWLLDWKIDTKIGQGITTNVPKYRQKVDEQLKQLRGA